MKIIRLTASNAAARRGTYMKFLTKPKTLIFMLVLILIFASVAMYVCEPSINTGHGEISHSDKVTVIESPTDISPTETVIPEPEPEPLPPDSVTIQMGEDVLLHDSVVKASKTGKNFMRLMPAGKYAFAEEKPSFFKDNSAWKNAKMHGTT